MMKILASQTLDFTINGLMSALVVDGHHCSWITPGKSIYDAFFEFEPNLIFCTLQEYVQKYEEPAKENNIICVVLNSNINEGNTVGYSPKPAANLAQMYGKYDERFRAELSYVHFHTNHDVITSYLENFIFPNYTDYYLKIYGNPVPYVNYIGKIGFTEIATVLKSSKFYLDYLNDLVLDAWLNGCVSIPYRSNPLVFPEELFGRYEDANDLSGVLLKYQDSIFRNKQVKDVQRWVLDGNTYFDRAAEIFDILSLTHNLQNTKTKVINGLSIL